MNTTASFSSEHSWSRRCSTETIFSIQGKETDFVRDTSDTEWFSSDGEAVEYEPVTEPEDDGPLSGDSSSHSDNEIIATKVIEVSVGDDGELQLADSEQTASSSDSEMDLHDYWLCAHCRAKNNNPMYRYCEKCFKERKNFFPPRPKRKRKRTKIEPDTLPRTLSQDSGVESAANSQELSQYDIGQCSQNSVTESISEINKNSHTTITESLIKTHLKRRAQSADRFSKRVKINNSDSESDTDSCKSSSKSMIDLKTSGKVTTVNNITKDNLLPNNTLVKSLLKKFNDSESGIDLCKSSSSTSITKDCDGTNSSKDLLSNKDIVNSLFKEVSDSDCDNARSKLILNNETEVRPIVKTVSDSEANDISTRSGSILKDDVEVAPLVKMVSDPALTVEEPSNMKLTKKLIVNTLKEKLESDSKDNLCIICLVEPKSGVFVHGRVAHICCCYKCAVKVWSKAKRCPVCNCKVSNVLKAVVM